MLDHGFSTDLQLGDIRGYTLTKELLLKRMASIIAAIVLTVVLASPSHAGIGVAGRAGTLGLGVEVTQSLIPMVNVRGGLNWFNYSFDGTESGIRYNMDLKLKSFTALLDLHPIPLLGFRLSGGIVFNQNGIDGVTDQIVSSINIGGQDYTESGTLESSIDFKSTAPYLGIGWGNAANSRIGIAIDLGVAFQGSPQTDLRVTGSLASAPGVQSSIQQEERELQDALDGFKYYPVLSVGLSFKITP
tara:strand:- start:142 stop:876 length:735 start_codon:yes stop_codon:yes gene_type:complete